MTDAGFYRAFEERYRGPRELVKSRQSIYLPFVLPLKDLYSTLDAVDLGCGRGEWLELMLENGLNPQGVELDEGMLDTCRELALPVSRQDALDNLKAQPDQSHVIVSAFHVIEHISFDDVLKLVKESLRVLKPAGLLILETPNPENIAVGTNNFYVDPSHQRPIPHQLLAFLTEYTGFFRTKVLRLQGSPTLTAGGVVSLLNVLNGVSPDYSVIAQKAGSETQLGRFDAAFARDYGLTLEALSERYDSARVEQVHERAIEAWHIAKEARDQAQQAERSAKAAWQEYQAIANSRSWRITYPLRAAADMARRFASVSTAWLMFSPSGLPRRLFQRVGVWFKKKVKGNPLRRHG